MIIAIGGPAGSGKTTLADALADALGLTHLDFDVVTKPAVDAQRELHPSASEAQLLSLARDARYELLGEAVAAAASRASVIVSAPFTREAASADAWTRWRHALSESNANADANANAVTFIWVDVDPDTRRRRMVERASSRDADLLARTALLDPAPRPVIDHVAVPGALPTAEQVERLLPLFL